MVKTVAETSIKTGIEIVALHFKIALERAKEELEEVSPERREMVEYMIKHISMDLKMMELIAEAEVGGVTHRHPIYPFLLMWMSIYVNKPIESETFIRTFTTILEDWLKETVIDGEIIALD